jgi:hypothetical protein
MNLYIFERRSSPDRIKREIGRSKGKSQTVKERISLGELVRKSLGEYLKKESKKKGGR